MNRPDQVGQFLSWHRQLDRRPSIKNVQGYGKKWDVWHDELRKKEDHADLCKGGGNSIFLLILSLRWWMDEVDELNEGDKKKEANERLAAVLEQLDKSMNGVLRSRAIETTVPQAMSEES